MSNQYLLVFVSPDRQCQRFLLSSTGLEPVDETVAAPRCPEVLVLPAAVALPFKIKLPFCDEAKIARVLPQFVADIYSSVDERWHFSWSTSALALADGDKPMWQVSGLVLPPGFGPENYESVAGWRLAVPDVFLARLDAGAAVRVKTPVAEVVAICGAESEVERVIRSDSGVELQAILSAANVGEIVEFDLSQNAAALFERVKSLLNSESRLDLSRWGVERRTQFLKLGSILAVAALLIFVIISHFFLWLECRATESAAQRTRAYIADSFRQSFAGVPVVEPISQVRSRISQARTSLSAAAGVPDVPWQSLFSAMSSTSEPSFRVARLQARETGFRISGSAESYAAVEAFRRSLEKNSMFESVKAPELRQVSGTVSFTLEGKWKR